MSTVVDVNVGEVKVGAGSVVLRAMALGSCIGAVAFDGRLRIGGLAHIMLPGAAPRKAVEKNKYAVDAIDDVIRRLSHAGAHRDELEFCLVGAGNVLEKDDDTICTSNIDSVIRTLNDRNIAVRASLLGGTLRKSVSLDVEKGLVSCSEGDGKERVLWSWA